MTQSGCLLIDVPSSDPLEQTRPLLLGTKASPSLLSIVPGIDPADQPKFFAELLSEDAGEDVQLRLLVDYGTPNVLEDPYRFLADFDSVAASSLASGPRLTPDMTWAVGMFGGSPGCHTITLMASHAFDDKVACPADLADSSQLTWMVEVCAIGAVCPTTCNDLQLGCVAFACPQPTVACPAVSGVGGSGVAGGSP